MSAPSVITLTPAAIEFAREAIAGEDCGLRVAIVGGGCSGYNYALNLDDDLDEEDLVLQYPHEGLLFLECLYQEIN